MGEILTKADLQKVILKNVTINFDYDWINSISNYEEEANQLDTKVELDHDEVLVSEDEDVSDQDEPFSIEDILRSIKSIEIG